MQSIKAKTNVYKTKQITRIISNSAKEIITVKRMVSGYNQRRRAWVLLLLMALTARMASGSIDCSTVESLVSNCSNFITYGVPEPALGSPCCNAVASINNIADDVDNRRSTCGCLMNIINTYNHNATATAIARLPGLCGVSLGFTIDPNTDCNSVP